ncbi:MAG: hypothetical protein JO314_06550 [Acidobacteria bacterium]|nr:hypothetical protein [Acidobacteriota bacterium]
MRSHAISSDLFIPRDRRRSGLLLAVLVLWGIVAAAFFGLLWVSSDLSFLGPGSYLLPWILLSATCILSPTAYLLYKRRFDPFHPLVFAAWSYIFPAFVVGGVIISMGWADRYFTSFITDPEYNLPLTLVYISVGYLALTAGFFSPVGTYITRLIDRWTPKWQWSLDRMRLPGVLLLLAGVAFNFIGFVQGVLGYQKTTELGVFDGLLFFLLTVLTIGSVLLWLVVFSARERTAIHYLLIAVLLALVPLRPAMEGSRSGLFTALLPIAMAYVYSGRKFNWRIGTLFAIGGSLAVFIGITYGTTFRNIKGSEERINSGEYLGQVVATVDYLSQEDTSLILQQSVEATAQRIDNLSSVAVVVANYEALAPYEASYGLQNNIFNDLSTSLVPRFVWPDKPQTSDPRAYSDLYFNFGDNSFAISPFGDLLRNFGPLGVPIGMLVLGIYLRFIYAALIDTATPALWKKVAYFPLLTVVSYEGFFATIFPSIIRTAFVLVICLLFVNLFSLQKRTAVQGAG